MYLLVRFISRETQGAAAHPFPAGGLPSPPEAIGRIAWKREKYMTNPVDSWQKGVRCAVIPTYACPNSPLLHLRPMTSAARLSIFSTLMLLLLPSCGDPPPPLTQSNIGPGIGPFDSRGNYREDWADDPRKWRRPSSQLASNDRPPPNANPLPPSSAGISRPTPSASTRPPSRPVASSTARPATRPPARPSTRYHTIRRGDSLSAIASRYGTSVAALRRANNISGNLIHPGKRLVIPSR